MLFRMISIDEFKSADLRVGVVREAVRVEGSEKLLRLSVDLGEKDEAGLPAVRQIIAGIGKVYTPETMFGKQIVVVANLEPRKLMGLESNGMLLAAHDEEGNPIVLVPQREAKTGSKIS
jgi:methionine--tRNA ligase beta chain